MARTGENESKAASADAAKQQDAANAVTMGAVNKYNTDLGTLQSGKNPFANPFADPTYLSNLNRDFATTADATAGAAKANIQNTALRTGDNSSSYTEAIKNNQRQAQQTANTGLNAQHSADYGKNLDWQTAMLNADLAPTGASNSAYGTAVGGRDSANSNLTQLGLASYSPWTAAIAAAGGAAGGALGNTKLVGCWIAEAIYGVDDARTHLVRAWLNTEFTKKPVGRVVMAAYLKVGQRVAKLVRNNRMLEMALRPLFDAALRKAEAWSIQRPVHARRNWWDACLPLLVPGD